MNNSILETSTLFHGTSIEAWNSITKSGFIVPNRNRNWLGAGVYFGVNNMITPTLFAQKAATSNNSTPVIIEFAGSDLLEIFKSNTLDLTSHNGLTESYFISKTFNDFCGHFKQKGERDDNYLYALNKNPLYSDFIKTKFTVDIDYQLLMKMIEDTSRYFIADSPLIDNIQITSKMNVTNLIYDWYNYFSSSGLEDKVPVRGILGSFNNGNPIIFDNSIRENNRDKINEKVIYDFISFLSRIEYSLFVMKYYTENELLPLDQIFVNTSSCKLYIGKDQISKRLAKVFDKNHNNSEELAKSMYETIAQQRDKRIL